MEQPRIIVFGYDRLLLASLEVLTGAEAEVAAVVVPSIRADALAGEVRAEVAARGFCTIEQPGKAAAEGFAERLAQLAPDLIFVWSYPMILPREVIEIPRLGCVNLHMGLLPQYRGVNGLKWALLNGESETGVTLHYMDEGVDTGDMIARASFPITGDDDLVSLMRKARYAGIHLLKNTWLGIADGSATRMPQDESIAGYYSSAMKPSREIDWSRPAAEIHNLIRASPPPFEGVYTFVRGERIVVRRTALTEPSTSERPGTIVGVNSDQIVVATGNGCLVIKEAEMEKVPESSFSRLIQELRIGDYLGS